MSETFGSGAKVDLSSEFDVSSALAGTDGAHTNGIVMNGADTDSVGMNGADTDSVGMNGADTDTVGMNGQLAELATAREHVARLEQQLDSMTKALLSRDVIGQAKGILMATRQVTAQEAFGLLSRTSQSLNRKLADLAADVALTGALPELRQRRG